MRSNVEKLSEINRLVEEYRAEADLINRNQGLLGWDVTPFTKLAEISVAKDPYEKLWTTAWQWQNASEQWLNGSFRGLNAEMISDEVGPSRQSLASIQSRRLGSKHVANIS